MYDLKYVNPYNLLTRLWTTKIEDVDAYIESATIDDDGCIYIAGSFFGEFENYSTKHHLGFLGKYDLDGNKEWVKITDDYIHVNSISISSDGSILLTGYSRGEELIIKKFSSDGDLEWENFSNTTHDRLIGNKIKIGKDNSIYITGEIRKDYSYAYELHPDYVGGDSDVFVAKFDENGNEKWFQVLGSTDTEYSNTITLGINDSIYIAGKTLDSNGSFDGQSTSSNYSTAFLSKFSNSGDKKWTKVFSEDELTEITDLEVGEDGSIYAAGRQYSDNFEGAKGFIAKYNSSGEKVWLTQPLTFYDIEDIDISNNNYIYITGYGFNNSPGTPVAKYNLEGIPQWTDYPEPAGTGKELIIREDNIIYAVGDNFRNDSFFIVKIEDTKRNEIVGTHSSETLEGSNKNEDFFGRDGHDLIDGSLGIDKALYKTPIDNIELSFNPDIDDDGNKDKNALVIIDNSPSLFYDSSIDYLKNIEILSFYSEENNSTNEYYFVDGYDALIPVEEGIKDNIYHNYKHLRNWENFSDELKKGLLLEEDVETVFNYLEQNTNGLIRWTVWDGGYDGFNTTRDGVEVLNYDISDNHLEFLEQSFSDLDLNLELDFKKVNWGTPAELVLWVVDEIPGGAHGFAHMDEWQVHGNIEVFIDVTDGQTDDYTKSTFVHEVGHALGLSHPGINGEDFPYWNLYTQKDTIMSYNPSFDEEGNEVWGTKYTQLDIKALRSIWGEEGSRIATLTDQITGQTFNLDVDGDGKVAALGDGLMVIRKLFGAAFAGDVLTNKAISNTATRTTQEIHNFIQAGIDEKVLDVDGDGSVTALGDGLMVIRKLFGAAFAGEALTSKAISNNATRTTDEIHEYIAAMSEINFLT